MAGVRLGRTCDALISWIRENPLLRLSLVCATGASPSAGSGSGASNNELPSAGHARVYPTALVAKIVLAQVLLALT